MPDPDLQIRGGGGGGVGGGRTPKNFFSPLQVSDCPKNKSAGGGGSPGSAIGNCEYSSPPKWKWIFHTNNFRTATLLKK